MKIISKVLTFLLLICSTSCVNYKQNKGLVVPKSDEVNVTFTSARSLVIIPVNLNGTIKQFVIDSGDELTTINRKEPKGRVSKVGSATGKTAKAGQETIASMKIGDMEFENIRGQNLNFEYVEKEIPNYGGLIGQSVLSKANWMIDYPAKKLKISTKSINTDGFETILVKNIRDPKININIDGEIYTAFVDLGSSTAFAVVESTALGKKLASKITFVDEIKETFTASGLNTSTVKRGMLPSVKIGNVEINNISMIMGKSSSHEIRIGMSFFKDCMLYLDYENRVFKIKKIR